MEIASLVTPFVVRADASETLATVARRMWAHEIGALPVFDGEVLAGIVTERDVVTAMALGAGPDAGAAAFMTPRPVAVRAADDAAMVARRMLDLDVRHLPVVDGERVVGTVSARDLLALVAWPGGAPANTLAASA
jgi:CBS domain-containing protein